MKPDALVVGPMKSGTTWIHDYLGARGDVCLPKGVKETFYFDRNFGKGTPWYFSHFSHFNAAQHLRTMEIAPSLFHDLEAPNRIFDILGSIPIIVTLRDPVKRSWSHYLHLKRKGYTRKSLSLACVEFPEILQASRYSENLCRWCELYPANKIKVVWQEDLARDHEGYAQQISSFLNLPLQELPESSRTKSNAATVPPSTQLARLGTVISNQLRSHRIYGVVNAAKKLGLKKLFYGVPVKNGVQKMTDEEVVWLAEQLVEDFEALPEKYQNDFVHPPALYKDQVKE